MVLSYQNQNIAFSAAENALRAAEYFITELTDPTIEHTTNENYTSWNQANRKAFKHMDFSQIDWSQVDGENKDGDLKRAYKIQYLGQRHLVGEELAIGQSSQIYGSRAEFFRIGAYGEGPQRAKRVLDVVFATLI
jgi:Tfp pilus assembly protein PilX